MHRIRWRSIVVSIVFLAVFVLNGLAWMQAWNFSHFVPEGQPPPRLDQMSLPEQLWVMVTGVRVAKPQNAHTPRDLNLEYEVHRIPLENGESLEAWWIPHTAVRGVVLMFHGYATCKESLLAPAAALHNLGYAVFMVDFRGSGGSTGYDTTFGLREGKDVAASVAYVQRTWSTRPLVLYGFSMGTAAVLRAVAAEGVQPDAIILEAPFDSMLNAVRVRFDDVGFPASPASELLVFWGSVQQGLDGFEHNPATYARAVTCPALVLHGDRDSRVTNEQALAVFDHLAGRKQLVNFPGAGHELLLLRAPNRWTSAMGEFLSHLQ